MRRIYLDHTATTPMDPRVLEAMLPYFSETFGNASSVHAFGREARQALEQAREAIARAIGAAPGEILFTSGGTESDNAAIRGVALANRGKRRILTTRAEHHAVLESCEALRQEGWDVLTLPVDATGAVDPGEIRGAVNPETALISVMHANNEVGTVSRIDEIAAIARATGVPLHTDAVQSLGKIPVNVHDLGVDLLSLSAHKIYGPKGIGALYIRKGTALERILHGGGQERGRRPGTENVALAVGFGRAVELAEAERERESDRLRGLRDTLETRLRDLFPDMIVNGDPSRRLPHLLSISFDSGKRMLQGEMLLVNMDLAGIAASSGSACTSGSVQPSHVLLAMGRDVATARATLRFSFGRSNTLEDVSDVAEALNKVLGTMSRKPPKIGDR